MRGIFVAALVGLASVQAAPTNGAGGTHEAAQWKRGGAGGSLNGASWKRGGAGEGARAASWKRGGAGEGARAASWKRGGAGEGARAASWKRAPSDLLSSRSLWEAVDVVRRWVGSGSVEDLD